MSIIAVLVQMPDMRDILFPKRLNQTLSSEIRDKIKLNFVETRIEAHMLMATITPAGAKYFKKDPIVLMAYKTPRHLISHFFLLKNSNFSYIVYYIILNGKGYFNFLVL